MDARAELQSAVDRMADACMANDWPAFRAGLNLPFELVTAGASLVIEDDERMRQGFDTFAQMIQLRRVTAYIRPVLGAEFPAPGLLTGAYETHLLCRAERVVPPYTSRARLRLTDGAWRFERIVNTWENERWPVITPIPGEAPISDIDADA